MSHAWKHLKTQFMLKGVERLKSPQWVTGPGIVIGRCPCSYCDIPPRRAFVVPQEPHRAVRDAIWPQSGGHIAHCACVCGHIDVFFFTFSIFWQQMAVQPRSCVLRRWTKLGTCTGTVAKTCLGSTGVVRTGECSCSFPIWRVLNLHTVFSVDIDLLHHFCQGCSMRENPVFSFSLQAHWEQCCSHRNHHHCGQQ